MLHIRRLAGLVAEIGQHGLLFGTESPGLTPPGVESGSVAEALPAVREYIDNPVLPEGAEFPGLTAEDVALALVAGARRALEDVQAIERAAAAVAREHGVTIRQLAQAAGISERAANDRYRKVEVFNPEQQPPVKWDPADADPGALEAPAGGQDRPPRDAEQDDQA